MRPFDVFKRDLQVLRKGPGSYINGSWQDGDIEEFTIKASVHPASADVIEMLPEGYRNKSLYQLFTDTKLKTSVVNVSNPDLVIIDNEKYTVIKVAHWNNTYLRHYEVIVVSESVDNVN